ncbi:hypothetical protein ebA407 [Aromatoleum aromaticum EbN1]|uniref:Uncharacterized protein n=1 Tax=Aromatoleum aromaticum (strain DSM 19018 / LMG 30748 / EbN1) TaxID=76114 RepID=Q5P8M5_AROAE|nr:hypothetical protein ebA407 [Aromatoleum aromaticum EbN1]
MSRLRRGCEGMCEWYRRDGGRLGGERVHRVVLRRLIRRAWKSPTDPRPACRFGRRSR